MNLNQYAADKKKEIFAELEKGIAPSQGHFDMAVLAEARTKRAPQMGATSFTPEQIRLEFIYPDPQSSATVFMVTLASPERIVFLPVPNWVVENIWQGEISGTFHFEAEATRLVADLQGELAIEKNRKYFDRQMPKRRE